MPKNEYPHKINVVSYLDKTSKSRLFFTMFYNSENKEWTYFSSDKQAFYDGNDNGYIGYYSTKFDNLEKVSMGIFLWYMAHFKEIDPKVIQIHNDHSIFNIRKLGIRYKTNNPFISQKRRHLQVDLYRYGYQ